MKLILLVALTLLIPGITIADEFKPEHTITAATKYRSGDLMPQSEIREHRIYCEPGNVTPATETPKYVLTMPQLVITTQNADWLPFGDWSCGAITIATNGEPSVLSNIDVFPVAPNPHPPVCFRCLRAVFPMARHPLHILCRLRFPVARDPYPTTRAPFPVTWRPHHVASRPRGPDLYPRGWWHHRIFNGSDTMPGPELDFYTSRRRGLLGACYGPWMERAAGDHDDARRGYGKNEPSHRLFLSSWNVYV